MKKIFTLLASAIVAVSANAQVVVDGSIKHTFYTEVEPNTYAVTTTLEAVTEAWGADNLTWGMGVRLPVDYVLVDDAKMTMTTAVNSTPIYFSGNKHGDMQKDFPAYNGYMNLGCSFGPNNWKGNEPENYYDEAESLAGLYKNHHGIFAVVPKVDGTLSFGVYAGDNSRSIGIIDLATEEEVLNEKPSTFAAYKNFRNDGVELDPETGEVTVLNAPAYVSASVKAGRKYLLVGGDGKNLTMHQVKFVPTATSEPQFQLYTEVEENTYAVTATLDEVKENFDAQWVKDAWDIGVALPAGTVVLDNDKLTMSAAVNKTPVYFQNNKITQIKDENPGYQAYMNIGCSFEPNNWKGNEPETIYDDPEVIAGMAKSNHGIFAVVPKVDGTLSFGVYAGDNSRSIGIIDLATEEEVLNEKPSTFVAYKNFRNDGVEIDPETGEVTVKNAPGYVSGAVKAGRKYLLVGGANKNLNMHQVKFVPGTGSGIENVAAETSKTAPKKVFKNGQIMIGDFNIAGQRVK